MDIKSSVSFLLQKAGETVNVTIGTIPETIVQVKAIIQPMRYKNKLYVDMAWGNLGFKDTECFLYIGPPEVDFTGLELRSFVKTVDRAYCISRADRIRVEGETVYIWAVLTPKIKENAYDLN